MRAGLREAVRPGYGVTGGEQFVVEVPHDADHPARGGNRPSDKRAARLQCHWSCHVLSSFCVRVAWMSGHRLVVRLLPVSDCLTFAWLSAGTGSLW